jgi:hypothetical protein
MKFLERYDLILEPRSNTKWHEPRDHIVTQPIIK